MTRLNDEGEPVVIDACVLAVFAVIDLLLLIAERSSHFTPRWTGRIIEEMHRAHLKFGWGVRRAVSFRDCLDPAFREARIVNYEALIERCTNHEGDRHVLAAAIKAQVSRILTFNLRHFPEEALSPWKIAVLHPQDYLLELFTKDSKAVWAALRAQAEKQNESLETRLEIMARHVPKFSARLLAELA